MKKLTPSVFAASLAAAAILPATAHAQVNGFATSNPAVAIAGSSARNAAYKQIQTTYAANIQQINTLRGQIEALKVSLDTNKDKQITEAEVKAKPAEFKQVQDKEKQINTATQPIALAQYYVIEQLLNDYQNAEKQVIDAKKISIMLEPDAIQYAPEAINVTKDIIAAINQRLPNVATAVPANWKPRQQTAQMHQAVQQILILASQQAAARQAQQQPQNNQAPTGR